MSAINDAPVLANPVASISLIANIPNTYTLPADLFVDPDIGDQIVITATLVDGQPLPDWLHFDATTLTFAATPTTAQLATPLMLLVSATDMSGFVTSTYIPIISAITGTEGNDTLVGTAYDDVIYGGLGSDTLNGTAGADKLVGGAGNDIYVVDHFDTLIENVNEGFDIVQSDISWTLGSNFEYLSLTGTAAVNGTGNDFSNSLIGNSADNILDSGAGNDWLDGGLGADILIGGTGNDGYAVDDVGDMVIETSTVTSEIDTVRSNISYTLTSNVERLELTGGAAINAIGNELDNFLYGHFNSAANILKGGLGNDNYMPGINDTVLENADEGIDSIFISANNYTLGVTALTTL